MANDVPINAGIGTNVETLQQADADLSHRQVVHMADWKAALELAIQAIANPLHVDQSARMRVSIENIAGALTLSTITTVGTVSTVTTVATVTNVTTVATVASVTNLAQIGSLPAATFQFDISATLWVDALRGRIT